MGLVQPGLSKAEDKARVAQLRHQKESDRLYRQYERRGRTPQQQLRELDLRLGVNNGAEKERLRLTAQIEANKTQSVPVLAQPKPKAKKRKAVAV